MDQVHTKILGQVFVRDNVVFQGNYAYQGAAVFRSLFLALSCSLCLALSLRLCAAMSLSLWLSLALSLARSLCLSRSHSVSFARACSPSRSLSLLSIDFICENE